MPEAASPQSGASAFIQALAWLSIVFAAFSLLAGLLQCLLVPALLPDAELNRLMGSSAGRSAHPLLLSVLRSRGLLALAPLAMSSATIVSAVGLLMRRNWARIAFIVLLSLGIPANLASLALVRAAFSSIPPIAEGIGPAFFQPMLKAVEFAAYAGLLGVCALLGWLVRKLATEPVRSEFAP